MEHYLYPAKWSDSRDRRGPEVARYISVALYVRCDLLSSAVSGKRVTATVAETNARCLQGKGKQAYRRSREQGVQ